MAYKVLYRKYRPQDFDNLYGQDQIKTILMESINQNKISHAYLFCGPRGTGKTSTAKIFAKAINCENPVNGNPCNSCSSCQNFQESPDIIEIDAASNNGVDEIRNLRDNAKILPTSSKYKIYIIDEVHMLSQSAWNAFLKILEEPPKHIVFILATTEIQKVPITILSRCQRFNFQKITLSSIIANITKISTEENINITDDAIKYIAELSDGGMRDALSILDQLSKDNKEITIKEIKNTFGVIGLNDINNIFGEIYNQNYEMIDNIFHEYENKGLDVNLFINKLINYLLDLEIATIKNEQHKFTVDQIKSMSLELSNCYNKKGALTLIKIILLSYTPQKYETKENITDKEIVKNENSIPNTIITEENDIIDNEELEKSELDETTKKIRINNSFASASKELKTEFIKCWNNLKQKISLNNNVEIMSIIEDTKVEVVSTTNVLFSNASLSTTILFNQKSDTLEQEYQKESHISLKFICLSRNEWEIELENYKKNKNKKNYKYIEEMKEKNEKEKIIESAMNIFSDSIIEIK